MAINVYKAYHFNEYLKIIEDIGMRKKIKAGVPPVLWSRGHNRQDWYLQPTLLRDVELKPLSGVVNATERAMEEEIRKQHYAAKNYHFFSRDLFTKIEWMEVMQHHGVKTRMLDWSESTLHSLLFALECFFDNKQYRTEDRINSSPCVWILEPIEWNMIVLENILSDRALIQSCLESLQITDLARRKAIEARFGLLESNLAAYMEINSARHLRGIFNLSSIMNEMQSMRRDELLYLMEKGELLNCLSYLLAHIYISTDLKKLDQVMPLSIVESYHSERIKAQKGAFSIFPYYEESKHTISARKLKIPLDSMEYMDRGNHLLHKISLCNPDEIAFEVMNAGMNISWLYPEMPVVANAVEKREIFY